MKRFAAVAKEKLRSCRKGEEEKTKRKGERTGESSKKSRGLEGWQAC